MTIIRYDYRSPIGALTLVADDAALMGLYFEQHKVGGPPADARTAENAVTKQTARALDAYFEGRAQRFALPLGARGTEFQRSVWRALEGIGFGETRTYSSIAAEIGKPAAVRAVGAAVGRNPISIIVPCHRVIGANGALTGFAGGVERKSFLLDLERNTARIAC